MSHRIFRLFLSLIILVGLAAMQAPPVVRAAGPWYVSTTGNDANDCLSPSMSCATINGAIGKASAGETINVAEGTYTGVGTEVVLIDRDIILSGGWDTSFIAQGGASLVDGEGTRRAIRVINGVTATVLSFTLQNGFDSFQGAGIFNTGALTMTNSTIRANVTSGDGGGIFNVSGGTLTLNNSIVSGNIGTGIFNACDGGDITLNSSTISHNSTGGGGGGIVGICDSGLIILNDSAILNNTAHTGGGIWAFATITLNRSSVSGNLANQAHGGGIYSEGGLISNNSTISSNQAQGFGGGIYHGQGGLFLNNTTISANTTSGTGGGVFQNAHEAVIRNSIIAGNTASSGQDCAGNVAPIGTIVSAGYNLIGNTAECDFAQTNSDFVNIDANLGVLLGTPGYHPLLTGSPAIDAGNPAGCTDQNGNLLTTDQRGVARPQGLRCDIGAFELEAENPVIEVPIDIIPGSTTNIINLRSAGTVPVAILSTATFNAPALVNKSSLTFGKTGNEASLSHCLTKQLPDVNGDGRPDLLCYFRIGLTGLAPGNTQAILRGLTMSGTAFEGVDLVKVSGSKNP